MKKILTNKYIILIPILILNIISLIYLYQTPYLKKQLFFLFLSYSCLFIFSKLNFKHLIKYSKLLYLISVILLSLVLIYGKEINGSKAWIHIFGISIQPSEITKLALSLYLPYLALNNKNFFYLCFITLIPTILTFLEPDTGAIIFYLIILLTTLTYSKPNKKIITCILVLITLFISINITIYFSNKDILTNIYGPNILYRIDRIISFKNQDNIQTTNSLISIGSHNLLYIPENHNDFIFAAIISKFPFCFPIIIIAYILIFLYFIKYTSYKKNISNIINSIILNTLLIQTFYNIFMNLSLTPIIGIPLPFISYGGSYLVSLYTLIGILINLKPNNNKVV